MYCCVCVNKLSHNLIFLFTLEVASKANQVFKGFHKGGSLKLSASFAAYKTTSKEMN